LDAILLSDYALSFIINIFLQFFREDLKYQHFASIMIYLYMILNNYFAIKSCKNFLNSVTNRSKRNRSKCCHTEAFFLWEKLGVASFPNKTMTWVVFRTFNQCLS